jgi:hypothetical protein
MRGVFAACDSTVMTGNAVRRDSRVIEERRDPSKSAMTVRTLIRAGNMVHWLRSSDLSDVTAIALSPHTAVVHQRGLPETRRMAFAAGGLNGNVLCRRTRLGTRSTTRVAFTAANRRACELPSDMAGLTIRRFMPPDQRESCHVVIEGRFDGLGEGRRRDQRGSEDTDHGREEPERS